jgi:hypothetical protein
VPFIFGVADQIYVKLQVKTVFIDLLPPSWDEGYVQDLLKKYGEVEKVELAKNMPAARRKNYGFVTFATHAAAVECSESITSAGLGEGSKKVCLAFKFDVHVQQLNIAFLTLLASFRQKLGLDCRDLFRKFVENMLLARTFLAESLEDWQGLHVVDL